MTGTGLIVSALVFGLPLIGVEVAQGQIAEFVENCIKVIGFVLLVVGQVRRSDLRFGLFRK